MHFGVVETLWEINVDVIYLGLVALFAVLTWALIAGCRRLEEKK